MRLDEQERERARLFRESLEFLEDELYLVQRFESGELSSRLPREDWSSRSEWLTFAIQELRGQFQREAMAKLSERS